MSQETIEKEVKQGIAVLIVVLSMNQELIINLPMKNHRKLENK